MGPARSPGKRSTCIVLSPDARDFYRTHAIQHTRWQAAYTDKLFVRLVSILLTENSIDEISCAMLISDFHFLKKTFD